MIKTVEVDKERIKLQLWDTAGQEVKKLRHNSMIKINKHDFYRDFDR